MKVMLVIKNGGKILVSPGYDKVKDQHFYRMLGGGVNFQETVEEAIRREIKEELNSEIKNLKFLQVTESIFEYNGDKGHQICFIFGGELERKELLNEKTILVVEDDYEIEAKWVPIREILEGDRSLYPEIDLNLLRDDVV